MSVFDLGPDRPPLPSGGAAAGPSATTWTAAAVLAGIVLALGIGFFGTTAGHSGGVNLSWFVQYRAVLLGGGLPRHLPDMWSGLGGLDFFFYGHLPFFVSSVVSVVCVRCPDPTVFAAGNGIGFALSLLTFYMFARRFAAPAAAFAGAVIFAVMPYHLGVDWYWRQAAAEAFSYAFLPIIARGIDIALRDGKSAPSLAIGVALQLATHLPTAVLAVHVFGVTVLVWMIATRSPARVGGALLRLAGLSAIGAMLAAPFWLPAVLLIKDVTPELLFSDYFVANRWLVTAPVFTPPDRVIMILVVACFGLSAVMTLTGALAARPPRAPGRLWLIVPFVVSTILMTGLSRPLWEAGLLPKVQFPWRLMVFVEFSGALGAVLAAEAWLLRRRGIVLPAMLGAALAVSIGFNAIAMTMRGPVPFDTGGVRQLGVAEYLPPRFLKTVMPLLPPGEPLFRIVAVLQELAPAIARQGNVHVISREPRKTVVQPTVAGQSVAHVPVPWWPYWRAGDAEGALVIRPDPAGLMEITAVPARPLTGNIVIDLPWLPVEKAAAGAALFGVLALAALTLGARRRMRRSRPPAFQSPLGGAH